MQQADLGSVFGAAEDVLTGMGYQIDSRDEVIGVLTARGPEGYSDVEPIRRGTRLSSRPSSRRLVKIRVKEAPEAIRLFCQVAVQEQTTRAHRMFAATRAGDDRPGDTAIDRDAATTIEQNTVWQTIRRDKSEERVILAAIVERAGGERSSETKDD